MNDSETDKCPACGAPDTSPARAVGTFACGTPYEDGLVFVGVSQACQYAAGLRQDWAKLYEAHQLMTTVADEWQERAELSAEAERKALKRAERAEAERDALRRAIDRHKWEREQRGGWERVYDLVLMSKREALEIPDEDE